MFEKIPAKIHFVWVGGPIPLKQAGVVLDWSLRNPGYETHLWTDKAATNSTILAAKWDRPPGHVKVSDRETRHLPGRNSEFAYTNDTRHVRQKVQVHDITNLSDVLDREMLLRAIQEILNKNYGAASDILRIGIIKKCGGVYLDTDSVPKDELPKPLTARDAILLGCFTKGGNETFCNAVIAAPKGHPYLDEILQSISDAYAEWSQGRQGQPRLIDQYRIGVNAARDHKNKVQAGLMPGHADQELREARTAFQSSLDPTLVLAGPTRLELWLYKHAMEAAQINYKSPQQWAGIGLTGMQSAQSAVQFNRDYVLHVKKTAAAEKLSGSIMKSTYAFPDKYVGIESAASWVK